jgi:hypothetical protein
VIDVKQIELKVIITEEDNLWRLQATVPNNDNAFMGITGKTRKELLDNFAKSLDNDNIRYWYLMKEI